MFGEFAENLKSRRHVIPSKMKSLTVTISGLLLFLIPCMLNAQTEQMKIFVGGQSLLSFSSLDSKMKSVNGSIDYGVTTDINFAPQAGVFVINNLLVGFEFPINYSHQNDKPMGTKITTISAAAAPFVRYYFGTSQLKPYLVGSVGLGSTSSKYEPGAPMSSSTTKSGLFLYELGGGLGVFFTNKLVLDLSITYDYFSSKQRENNPNNDRNIGSGIVANLGIAFVL